MAFKMKGWSPFDKKEKKTVAYKKEEKTSMYQKEENKKDKSKNTIVEKTENRKYMDEVYDEVVKYLGRDAEGFSGREIANMTEEERSGNFNDYFAGDFDNLVKEAKKRLKNK
tara:strand:+ start:316 stop:651 length:336 start_codon:yes stop_codon:yes gene_type:complete